VTLLAEKIKKPRHLAKYLSQSITQRHSWKRGKNLGIRTCHVAGKPIVTIYINNSYSRYYGAHVRDVAFNLACNVDFRREVTLTNNFLLNWLFLFDLWFFSRGHVADGYSL